MTTSRKLIKICLDGNYYMIPKDVIRDEELLKFKWEYLSEDGDLNGNKNN